MWQPLGMVLQWQLLHEQDDLCIGHITAQYFFAVGTTDGDVRHREERLAAQSFHQRLYSRLRVLEQGGRGQRLVNVTVHLVRQHHFCHHLFRSNFMLFSSPGIPLWCGRHRCRFGSQHLTQSNIASPCHHEDIRMLPEEIRRPTLDDIRDWLLVLVKKRRAQSSDGYRRSLFGQHRLPELSNDSCLVRQVIPIFHLDAPACPRRLLQLHHFWSRCKLGQRDIASTQEQKSIWMPFE
mmetsp:Transcript_54099/g.123995  ORF Transcript_54099/g.123995 Transcript_54099/m.123995 type:complete len:236 (-) Transcript_54099:737-1444(-)